MEKHRICKICNRRFANGKAMGGHMRSHLAKLTLPPKPISPRGITYHHSAPKSPPSSSSLNYPLPTEKSMQSRARSINHEHSFVSKPDIAMVYDGESETESPRNPTKRRSKRSRKSAEKMVEPTVNVAEASDQVSSISFVLAEEDAALCLLLLSRDKWEKDTEVVVKNEQYYECIEEDVYGIDSEDEAGKEDDLFIVSNVKCKSQTKYRCETCNKVFRSYQALGGHRASHKKVKVHPNPKDEEYEEGSGYGHKNRVAHRIFECPFCDKVFESGQALGGHKKVHFSYLPVTNTKTCTDLLDLNLPAPEATRDDGEVSQV